MNDSIRALPRSIQCKDGPVEVRYLTAADENAILAFARDFPSHDLLFLARDITEPDEVKGWIRENEAHTMTTLLATRGKEILGCSIIERGRMSRASHVGELFVLTAPAMRGKGLGRQLTQEAFAVALGMGLEKITTQMTIDQQSAIEVFESMGFRGEALLRDHVKDRDGSKHDLVILSHDVARFQAQLNAYGRPEALGETLDQA